MGPCTGYEYLAKKGAPRLFDMSATQALMYPRWPRLAGITRETGACGSDKLAAADGSGPWLLVAGRSLI